MRKRSIFVMALAPALMAACMVANAAASTVVPGFNANSLPANDDSSTGLVPIGFSINYVGTTYSQLYVNNNGNLTFTAPLATYTPFGLQATSTPIIAPFFGDVDTRGTGTLTYGTGTYDGHAAFGATWNAVGYFNSETDKTNTFQVLLVNRADTGAGNFDIVYNYNQVQWETGDVSGGTDGLGGSSAVVGYSNGSNFSYQLPGSAVNGALIDGGPDALISHSNVGVPGTYIFQARNGTVVQPPSGPPGGGGAAPEPASLLLIPLAVGGLSLRLRKQRLA